MGRIIWLASYPKSGNTWLRALLANYLHGGDSPLPINALQRYAADESKPNWYVPYSPGRAPGALAVDEVTALRARVHADIAAAAGGSDVFVKTHNLFGRVEGHPLHNLEVTAGAIYMVRNPLDVVPSLAEHFGIGLDEAIDFLGNGLTGSPGDEANVAGALGSWSSHVASWCASGLTALSIVRYEDLHADAAATLDAILRFLGRTPEPERLQRAVRHAAFAVLRDQEEQGGFVERSPVARRFFRSGAAGAWKGALSDAQAGRIIAAHGALMARFGYLPPTAPERSAS